MPGVATDSLIRSAYSSTALIRQFYEALQDVSSDKMEEAVHTLVKDTLKTHKKIIFNGNGYSEEWVKEAAKRGRGNPGGSCLTEFWLQYEGF